MNFISKTYQKTIFLNTLLHKSFSASRLTFAATVHPLKDAIRFENQNKLWTFKEIEVQKQNFSFF